MKYSKSHEKYWLEPGRLFNHRGADYCCRFSMNGRRGFFDLNTANKAAAAKKAAEIVRCVVAHGWEAAERNPLYRTQSQQPGTKTLTVGDWITQVHAVALVAPITLASYASRHEVL